MKKFLTPLLLLTALFGFTACDDEPAEGEARTDFKYAISLNDDAKNLLDMEWMSAGNGVSMLVIDHEIEKESDLPWKGEFAGKFSTLMSAYIYCQLKKDANLDASKTYAPRVILSCTVTTKDDNGSIVQSKGITAGNCIMGESLSKAQMEEKFSKGSKDEGGRYTIQLGVEVKDGSISIQKGDKPGEWGSFAAG